MNLRMIIHPNNKAESFLLFLQNRSLWILIPAGLLLGYGCKALYRRIFAAVRDDNNKDKKTSKSNFDLISELNRKKNSKKT